MQYKLLKESALQELAEEDSLCTQFFNRLARERQETDKPPQQAIPPSENESGETVGEFLDRKGYDGEERRFLIDHLAERWDLNEDDIVDADDPYFHNAWDDARSELMLMYANGVWHR